MSWYPVGRTGWSEAYRPPDWDSMYSPEERMEVFQRSFEELKKRAKMTKFSSIMLIVAVSLQFFAGVYLTFKNGFNVFIILPMAFLPLIIVNFTNLKKINEDQKKRHPEKNQNSEPEK